MSEDPSSSLLSSFNEALGQSSTSAADKLTTWVQTTAANVREGWQQIKGSGSGNGQTEGTNPVDSFWNSINIGIWGDDTACFGLSRSQVGDLL
jgi:hypothetical protein